MHVQVSSGAPMYDQADADAIGSSDDGTTHKIPLLPRSSRSIRPRVTSFDGREEHSGWQHNSFWSVISSVDFVLGAAFGLILMCAAVMAVVSATSALSVGSFVYPEPSLRQTTAGTHSGTTCCFDNCAAERSVCKSIAAFGCIWYVAFGTYLLTFQTCFCNGQPAYRRVFAHSVLLCTHRCSCKCTVS